MTLQTPFEILNIPDTADDDDVRQAYLRQVKRYPPDRDPESFLRIKQAYESIKDRKSRLRQQLFTPPASDFNMLLDRALQLPEDIRNRPEQLLRLLKAGTDESVLLHALSRKESK